MSHDEWAYPYKIEHFRMSNVHDPAECRGRTCIVHNPANHHMSMWRLHYRSDRGIFERICPHGVGHPDPSQFDYWSSLGILEVQSTHGCCEMRCCFGGG